MKFAHLSDLHLGFLWNGYNLFDDQVYILNQITDCLAAQNVETVLLAGDIFDRASPSAEATTLLNSFLTKLQEQNRTVIMISGNHDSGERLEFGKDLLKQLNIHIIGQYRGTLEEVTLKDEYGPIHVYGLPFVRPSYINQWIQKDEEKVKGYNAAIGYVFEHANINQEERNIILSHQFITGTKLDENGSEDIFVGGIENVSKEVYAPFDYVALGHIHRPQTVVKNQMYYCGTPMPYSFGEEGQQKHILIVDMKEKGNIQISEIPLHPYREIKTLEGTLSELLQEDVVEENKGKYIRILFHGTDYEANAKLKAYYPYLRYFEVVNENESKNTIDEESINVSDKSDYELLEEFYQSQNGEALSEQQREYMLQKIEELQEKDK